MKKIILFVSSSILVIVGISIFAHENRLLTIFGVTIRPPVSIVEYNPAVDTDFYIYTTTNRSANLALATTNGTTRYSIGATETNVSFFNWGSKSSEIYRSSNLMHEFFFTLSSSNGYSFKGRSVLATPYTNEASLQMSNDTSLYYVYKSNGVTGVTKLGGPHGADGSMITSIYSSNVVFGAPSFPSVTNTFTLNNEYVQLSISVNSSITNIYGSGAGKWGVLTIANISGASITNFITSAKRLMGPNSTNTVVIPAGKSAIISVSLGGTDITNVTTIVEQ